jgi:surface protein
MKRFTNQSNGSHVGRMNYGGAKFCRFALFPLMLLMLLLLPTRMVAQIDYDESVTFTALAGNPEGNTNETYANLFDGKKTKDKFCSDANATQEVCYASLSAQPYVVFEESTGTLTFRYDTYKPEGAYDLNVGKNKPEWSSLFDKIKKVVFDASFANARPKSCYWWFGECYKLIAIEGIEYLNTENVTDMSSMFQSCSHSYPLDLTSFNTANVTDMSSMFKYCDITSLDLTSFNTANVTDMSSMFEHCRNLKSIFVSDKFVTDQITNGDKMFNDCTNLRGYNDSKIDHNYANCSQPGYFDPGFEYAMFDNATETLTFSYKGFKPVTYYYVLFEGRAKPAWSSLVDKIKKVVFDASFANARPKSCYWWFGECLNLTRIEGMENLNTEMVTTMEGMFYQCEALTSLDVTNFNTAKVTDMSLMFSSCTKLSSLNLYNFNTENVTNMLAMFSSCKNLATIYTSEKFVTTNVNNLNHFMFDDDEQLKGANAYDEMKTSVHCANYKTGYFTKLVGKNGDEKIGATGETLATDNLVLDDDKDFVAYEKFAAKDASYSRTMNAGTTWGTLCLPFGIAQSKETECKFYRLTGIDNECITLESYEGAEIPAGTPVLFKMNEGKTSLSLSASNAEIATAPTVAGTNTDVNLVGSFTKIGGKDNQGLADTDYIIGKDKFWRVSDLSDGKGVGIKPMRSYIHPATASQARAAMLSIGKGDGTTAIDNLNAISNDANAEYYDANGRRTNGLQKGLNIVKRGSKTYKIMVK